MRRIFWGFCRNWFLKSPLHYLSSRSDFGFEFAEIFIFEKQLPAITITGNRRSAYQWYGESPTPRITDTRSRQLPASLIPGVGDSPHHRYGESAIEFFKENSLYGWYGESSSPRTSDTLTPHMVESESHWLRVSPLGRVDDSAYSWVGESTTPRIDDIGSRYSKKKLIWCRFSELLTAKPCL